MSKKASIQQLPRRAVGKCVLFKQWSEEYLATSQKIAIKEDLSKLDQVLISAFDSRRIHVHDL
jgi:hypothetical protein